MDTPAYGVTSADIDNDGDLDFVVIRPSGKLPDWGVLPVLMYINHADTEPNNWLKVRLEGAAPNYFGVGATVLLEDDLAAGGIAWQQRLQISGSYCKSQQEMDLHFGVGATTVVGEVRVLWPSGVVSIVNDVAVNQTLVIQEIPTLESLTVSGPTVVAAGTVAYFTASALYNDDSIVNVTVDAVWSLDPMDYAAFNAPGELTAGAPPGDVTVEISASFDDMVGNTHIITIVAASPVDLDPPSVTITEPTDDEAYATEEASIQLTGQAADAYGVTLVEWRVNDGPAVPCSGTTTWSTGSIDLAAGENEVTITARDGAGNVGSDVLLVTHTPAGGSEPILAVSVRSVDFGQTEETRELAVWNDGDGDLDYSLNSNATWLSVTPVSGSSGGADDVRTHTLTIDRDAFEPGATVSANVVVADGTTANGAITVAVSAEAPPAEAAAPSLDVSADVLDFGTEGATRELSVFNAGGGTLIYEVIVEDTWIAVDPGSGASGGMDETVVHTVTVDRSGLEPGKTVSGTLKFVPDDPAIETVTVSVSATSSPPSAIDDPAADTDEQPDDDGTATPEQTVADPTADVDVPTSDNADDEPSNSIDDEPTTSRSSGCGLFGMLTWVVVGLGMGLLRSRARRSRRRN